MSSIQGGTRGQAQRWARVERDLEEEKTHKNKYFLKECSVEVFIIGLYLNSLAVLGIHGIQSPRGSNFVIKISPYNYT